VVRTRPRRPDLALSGRRDSWPRRPRTRRTQHSCGLRRPRSVEQGGCARTRAPTGPDTPSFPAPWPFQVRRAHLLSRRVQFGTAHGRVGSSDDPSFFRAAVRRGSGGPGDGASASSPHSLRQRHADLVSSPDPPTGRGLVGPPRTVTSRRGRRPIKPSGCRGCGPGHPLAGSWSRDVGVSSLGLAPQAPVRPRLGGASACARGAAHSGGRPVARCLTKRLTSNTSFVCSTS
jgi:hypothetical protein